MPYSRIVGALIKLILDIETAHGAGCEESGKRLGIKSGEFEAEVASKADGVPLFMEQAATDSCNQHSHKFA